MFLSIPLPIALLLFVLGVAFGSFGNVLITRLPRGESVRGRSHCRHCGTQLKIMDLIPILSFATLRGRCRACCERISWQYPFIEFLSGCLFLLAGVLTDASVASLFLAFALWFLLLIAVIDLRTQRIPDALNIPFIGCAIAFSVSTGSFDWFALTIAVGFLGMQWIVSRGRWVGSGDVLLASGISLLAGSWQLTLLTLMLAYVIGAIVAAGLLLSGRKNRQDALAFAPFLLLGILIAIIWGNWLLQVARTL